MSLKPILITAAALVVGLSACGGGSESSDSIAETPTSEQSEQTSAAGSGDRESGLTFNHIIMPVGFDPASPSPSEVPSHMPYSLVFDTLLMEDGNRELQPNLATAWEFGADGSYLELTLQDGVEFSNGEVFDAAAVAANLERSKAEESSPGAATLSAVTSIDVVDAGTVRLNLESGRGASLPWVLSTSTGMMAAPASLEAFDATKPVGTGPYVLTGFVPSTSAEFERRDDYWNASEATNQFETISYAAVVDQSARVNAVTTGQVDLAGIFGAPVPTQRADNGELQLFTYPSNNQSKLLFNMTTGPTTDVRVRQAINFALDREEVVAALDFPTQPAYQLLNETDPGHDPELDSVYAHDSQRATELLAEAGYDSSTTLTMFVLGDSGSTAGAQVVQAQLAEVGISVEIESVAAANVYQQWTADQPDLLLTRPGTFVYTPQTFMVQLTQAPIAIQTDQPELTALIEQADDPTLSSDEWLGLVAEMNALVTEQALTAPLHFNTAMFAATNEIELPSIMPWSMYPSGDLSVVSRNG